MTTPSFFNTLGRRLEPLQTQVPGQVRLYTCGPTVYNTAHIGNLRSFLFEDLLRRSLRYLGYEVHQVMNITDVDDKTIAGAAEAGQSLAEFTEPHIEAFFADLDTLQMERAERYPKATDHIPEMIELVETLIAREHAYVSEGSVFFRIASDQDYGRLSGFNLDEVRQGERVASDEYDKEDVRDFVLWKAAKDGEPAWDSPWGPGRPGWHLECSAMSMKYLGPSFDMHCGGVDNIFPHHENEIAQSESATGETLATTWLHAEHLIVDGEKMSKSLGNVYRLADLLEKGIHPRTIRYLFLSVHYRQKLNFTFASLEGAANALRRVDQMWFRLGGAAEQGVALGDLAEAAEELRGEFTAAVADDLNLSRSLAAVFGYIKTVNRAIEAGPLGSGDKDRVREALADVDRVLGFLDPAAWPDDATSAGDEDRLSDEEVDSLVQSRQQARQDKDFAEADRLRTELTDAGIVVEDTPAGPRWKRG